jgi:hypothetical protein
VPNVIIVSAQEQIMDSGLWQKLGAALRGLARVMSPLRKLQNAISAVRLAEALQVPLRERNALLLAAGYAPVYRQATLDASELEAARHAVNLFMAQLEPYPVLVLDRYWNTMRMNGGAKRFLGLFPGCDSGTPHNGVRMVFHPQGLRPFIENWEVVAARIIRRVHREVADNPSDEVMKRFLEELLSYPGVPNRQRILEADGAPPPFLTNNYRWKDPTLPLFSTLTSLGTALDIALQGTPH